MRTVIVCSLSYMKPSQKLDFGPISRRGRVSPLHGISRHIQYGLWVTIRRHTEVCQGLETRIQRRGWANQSSPLGLRWTRRHFEMVSNIQHHNSRIKRYMHIRSFFKKRVPEVNKSPLFDGRADVQHQVEVIIQIVNRIQPVSQQLPGHV